MDYIDLFPPSSCHANFEGVRDHGALSVEAHGLEYLSLPVVAVEMACQTKSMRSKCVGKNERQLKTFSFGSVKNT